MPCFKRHVHVCVAIDVVNCVSRSDGKRGMWKTSRMEARYHIMLIECHFNTEVSYVGLTSLCMCVI